MALLWTVIGTGSVVGAVYMAYFTLRIWRSNLAVYMTNQVATGNLFKAAVGRVSPLVSSNTTDFHINHFVEPCVANDGEKQAVTWERAASLSDEAVDSILARH